MKKLDSFTKAYIDCALWSSTDLDGVPLDESYEVTDIAPATLAEMIADCQAFQSDHWDLISGDPERAGHDFWLTRNHHGAGFWDGAWEDGDALTKAAHCYGSVDLTPGDDGKLYA